MGLILANAHVITSDDARPDADTLVVDGDVLTFVGDAADHLAGPDDDVVDLGGRTVVPGFVDAHAHPAMVTRSAWHVRLPWTENVEEILSFIRTYAAQHGPDEAPFLHFEYYPTSAFADRPPTKELLDTAVSDRPALCQDFSDHQHWVNSRMLELLGVDRATPDPIPGLREFVRDERGEPTGLVREFAHEGFLDTMYERLGWRPPRITADRVAEFLDFLTASGVTSVFEAIVDDEVVAAVADLESQGRLHLFYEGAVLFSGRDELTEAIAQARSLHERYGSPHLRVRTLKLFLDGTNESGNGATLEPLLDAGPGREHGQLSTSVDELVEVLEECNRAGLDLHVHLVGDRAFRTACDAVAAAREACATSGLAWTTQVTLAHCELVDPADMGRPAELGVLVNWTPHWAGGYFGEESRAHLGAERFDRMYRFDVIAESAATLTFGSDVVTRYEMHRGAPLFGMQVAAIRVDPEYPLDAERYPGSVRPPAEATLTVEQLLRGYTIAGARQLRLADRLGSLEPGKLANLVVLAEDPTSTEPGRISQIAVAAVMFEGRVVSGSLPEHEPTLVGR